MQIITLMVVGPLMYTTIFLVNWYRFSLTYAILLCASLMLATYTSLYAMPETIMRIKSIAPFFLWISFKRYRQLFNPPPAESGSMHFKVLRSPPSPITPECTVCS